VNLFPPAKGLEKL